MAKEGLAVGVVLWVVAGCASGPPDRVSQDRKVSPPDRGPHWISVVAGGTGRYEAKGRSGFSIEKRLSAEQAAEGHAYVGRVTVDGKPYVIRVLDVGSGVTIPFPAIYERENDGWVLRFVWSSPIRAMAGFDKATVAADRLVLRHRSFEPKEKGEVTETRIPLPPEIVRSAS